VGKWEKKGRKEGEKRRKEEATLNFLFYPLNISQGKKEGGRCVPPFPFLTGQVNRRSGEREKRVLFPSH